MTDTASAPQTSFTAELPQSAAFTVPNGVTLTRTLSDGSTRTLSDGTDRTLFDQTSTITPFLFVANVPQMDFSV